MIRRDWDHLVYLQLNDMAATASACSLEKGFKPPVLNPERFMLLTIGEIIEIHEDMRDNIPLDEIRIIDGKPTGPPTEIADLLIRSVLMGRSLAGEEGFRLMEGSSLVTHLTLADVVAMKMYHNSIRPPKHNRQF